MEEQRQHMADHLAERLTQLRHERGWGQQDAANHLGVSLRAYQRWEGAQVFPYPTNIQTIAEVYGIDVRELIGGEPELAENLQAQLDRIEAKLDDLLERLSQERLSERVADALREQRRTRRSTARAPRAKKSRPANG